MKRIIPMICAVLLMTLFVVNSSAQSFGTDESLIPYLDYTLTASDDAHGGSYSIHSPTIQSGGGQSNSWIVGNNGGRINDVALLAIDPNLGTYGDYTTAETELYFDFADSSYNLSGDPFRPSSFDIHYSPFTIKLGDVFQYSADDVGTGNVLDAYTLFDAIGASYEWYGSTSAIVDASVVFKLYYVRNQWADVTHGVIKYQPLVTEYRIDFQGDFNNSFTSSSLDVDGLTFYNVTDGISLTFDRFLKDIVGKTVLQRAHGESRLEDVYLDVETCNIRVTAVNSTFGGLIQSYAPYISQSGYDYLNGTLFEPDTSGLPFRQQHMSVLDALITSNMLNQQQLENIDFDEMDSPIVRVPALFLNAVASFFAIDFFGLGFTIGNLIGVLFLAIVVVIFLRLFAGG